jgi:hypothetical protein
MKRLLCATASACILAIVFSAGVTADGDSSGYHVVDPWIRPVNVTATSNVSGASIEARGNGSAPTPPGALGPPGPTVSRQAVGASPGVQIADLQVAEPSTATLPPASSGQQPTASAANELTNRVVQGTITVDGQKVQISLVLFSPTGGQAFGGLGSGPLGVRPVANTPLIIAQQQPVGSPATPQPYVPPNISIPAAPVRADPYAVALDVRAHIGLPAVQISIDPDIGLVGLSEYGWLAGYGGQDLVASRSVNIPPVVGPNIPLALVPANDPRRQGQSFTVSVRLTPTGYTWDFGDGLPMLTTTSLGAPYPQRSTIQHTYQRSSLGLTAGFAVNVTAHFAAAYQVNGGGWQVLAPVDHRYSRTQVVQQVQTVLVAGQ